MGVARVCPEAVLAQAGLAALAALVGGVCADNAFTFTAFLGPFAAMFGEALIANGSPGADAAPCQDLGLCCGNRGGRQGHAASR